MVGRNSREAKRLTFVRAALPFLLLLAFFILYQVLNAAFFVEWLGCGCPPLVDKVEVYPVFNANDLTRIVLPVLAVLAGFSAFWVSRGVGRGGRIVYRLSYCSAAGILTALFITVFRWR